MKVIGLFGPTGSGKTTVAKEMEKHGWVRRSLAQPLRDMLSAIVPAEHLLPTADKNVHLEVLGGNTVRQALQTLGTEWGRNCMSNDIWIRVLFQWAVEHKVEKLVVDDARFTNEKTALCGFGARMVRVRRPSTYFQSEISHSSEKDWRHWYADYHIDNDDGDLAKPVEDMLRWHDSLK